MMVFPYKSFHKHLSSLSKSLLQRDFETDEIRNCEKYMLKILKIFWRNPIPKSSLTFLTRHDWNINAANDVTMHPTLLKRQLLLIHRV